MKIVAVFPGVQEENKNQLLNTEHALDLPSFLKNTDHELVILDSDDDVDEHLSDMDVIISSPFLPAYITKERVKKTHNLKLAITTGVGSTHVELASVVAHKLDI